MRTSGAETSATIRPLTRHAATDAVHQLVALDAASRTEFGDRYSEVEWTEENFLRELPRKWSLSHVALQKEQLVGFIIGSHKAQGAHVHRLAVDSRARNRGVGRALLDALLGSASAQHLGTVTLLVAEDNLTAVRFYLGAGFVAHDRLTNGVRRQLSMIRRG